MKKVKFLVLIAFTLSVVTAFSSCSAAISAASSFDTVLNKDYTAKEEKTESVVEIEALRGYQFAESKGEFMLFISGDADSGFSRAVFSARNKRVVYLAESSSDESVEISLYSDVPLFTVSKVFLGGCADAADTELEMVYELYDATGTRIAESNTDSFSFSAFADILLINGSSYKVNEETGAVSKISDIPENLSLESCSEWNDEFFYVYGETINVYDRDFKHVYSWTVPSWADSLSTNMLNDGKLLVQYKRPLDSAEKDYDIYEVNPDTGETVKFELVTKLLDPKTQTEKDIKLKYLVNQVTTGSELVRTSDDNGMYRDDVENIAYVFPIEDKQVDLSDSNLDVVLMDNNGSIKKSLKLVEDQIAALPTCIGDNIYVIATAYGSAFVDIDGNVIDQINNKVVDIVGQNIVSDGMVYTLDMEEFYSLYDNGAEVLTYLDGTVFLKKGSDTEYTVIAIRGTEEKEICKYNELNASQTFFEELGDIGCYALCDPSNGEYRYYNCEHTLLHTSDVRLKKTASDFKYNISVYSATKEGEIKYYAFY